MAGLKSTGGGDPTRALLAFRQDVRTRVGLALSAVGQIGEATTKDELSVPGEGEPFVRYSNGQRREGRASKPGDPPAPDLGALRNSVQHEVDEAAGRVTWGPTAEYAQALNDGTTTAGPQHNVTIEPRPFMEPALERALPAMERAVITILSGASKGGA